MRTVNFWLESIFMVSDLGRQSSRINLWNLAARFFSMPAVNLKKSIWMSELDIY